MQVNHIDINFRPDCCNQSDWGRHRDRGSIGDKLQKLENMLNDIQNLFGNKKENLKEKVDDAKRAVDNLIDKVEDMDGGRRKSALLDKLNDVSTELGYLQRILDGCNHHRCGETYA